MALPTTSGQRLIATTYGAQRYRQPDLTTRTGIVYQAGQYVGDFTGQGEGYFLQVTRYEYVERTRGVTDEWGAYTFETYLSYEPVVFWVHRTEIDLAVTDTNTGGTGTGGTGTGGTPGNTTNASNAELARLTLEIQKIQAEQKALLNKPATEFDPVLMNSLSQKLGELKAQAAQAQTSKPGYLTGVYVALAVLVALLLGIVLTRKN